MSTCLASFQKIEDPNVRSTDIDDVDIELLIHNGCDSGNDEPSQRCWSTAADTFANAADGHVLNDSSESIGSTDEEQQSGVKTGFFGKQFFKSLPVSIVAKRKIFGSNTELPLSTSSSPSLSVSSSLNNAPASGSLPLGQFDRSSSCVVHQNGTKKMNWNIFVTDLAQWHEIELAHSSTCALLIHKLLSKLQRCPDLTKWSIILQNSNELIERFVEDHEIIDDVSINQDCDQIIRFCLSPNSGKYNILLHPEYCLPNNMLVMPPNFQLPHDAPDNSKRLNMQHVLTKTAPELCGWLHVRDPCKKSWKKLYCVLRNSGLYYSTKNTSKDAQHLVCIAEVHSANVWFPISQKKQTNYPNPFSFCLKPRLYNHKTPLRWFCAESQHLRTAWISGLRLTMNGSRFYESFLSARRFGSNDLLRLSSDRSINKLDGNFVAMDFSGSTGRVIQDPLEVAKVELERESSWRRRCLISRPGGNNSMERGIHGHSTPTKDAIFITRAIHLSQPWFYAKITREAAVEEIQKHGSLDGTFLVRDSRSIPGSAVVTVCHNQKPRHIPIALLEKDGQSFYSVDGGDTRFFDLIQFVDFHRLNKGNLPCPLLHACHRHYS